jgi:hypothetical protein
MTKLYRNCLKLMLIVVIAVMAYACDQNNPVSLKKLPKIRDVTLASKATLTVSIENYYGTNSAEGSPNFIDDDADTKFLIFYYEPDFWTQQNFVSPVTIDAYSVTSANDSPDRDPKSWKLAGSNDGHNWKTIDTQTDVTFPNRKYSNIYHLDATATYQFYRLHIMSNNGGSLWQSADWQLLDYNVKNMSDSTNTANIKLKINSISPTEVTVGSNFNIIGDNFSTKASDDIVKIGGKKATIVNASADHLVVKVPNGLKPSTYAVYLTVNGQQIAAPHVALKVNSP